MHRHRSPGVIANEMYKDIDNHIMREVAHEGETGLPKQFDLGINQKEIQETFDQ